MWKELTKQIAALIEEDKVVDTQFFGSFTRASIAFSNPARHNIVYCPGPKAILKLTENEDNVADLPQQLLDDKLVSVSLASVAEQSKTSLEAVNSVLSGVRDEIVDNVLVRKNNVAMNFGFGSLNLRAGGFIEFRSTSTALPDEVVVDSL